MMLVNGTLNVSFVLWPTILTQNTTAGKGDDVPFFCKGCPLIYISHRSQMHSAKILSISLVSVTPAGNSFI